MLLPGLAMRNKALRILPPRFVLCILGVCNLVMSRGRQAQGCTTAHACSTVGACARAVRACACGYLSKRTGSSSQGREARRFASHARVALLRVRRCDPFRVAGFVVLPCAGHFIVCVGEAVRAVPEGIVFAPALVQDRLKL